MAMKKVNRKIIYALSAAKGCHGQPQTAGRIVVATGDLLMS